MLLIAVLLCELLFLSFLEFILIPAFTGMFTSALLAPKKIPGCISLNALRDLELILHDDLLFFYTMTIEPILEYCCPVWHMSLTRDQSDHIEYSQQRAFSIVFGFSLRGMIP
jgi:hypothetical protein